MGSQATFYRNCRSHEVGALNIVPGCEQGLNMKTLGIVSYNIHCNFTNYGSALQSWALCRTVERLGYKPVLMDYCPDVLRDKNPLDPFKNMWDKDEESLRMCELTMPAIHENYKKFDRFYHEWFNRSKGAYISTNFNSCVKQEGFDGFVCGSDTIFCVDEFGIDDGYYANYEPMRGHSISYAASFGDSHFTPATCALLDARLKNFKAIGIRESGMVPYIKQRVSVPVSQVIDPTLLLSSTDFDELSQAPTNKKPYLLLYARRYNPKMEAHAINLAMKNGWRIVEISLRATNAERGHEMRYDAGVEEFIGLVKYAAHVVTNSYHGMIVAIHYKKSFDIFSREQCDTKIDEVLSELKLTYCKRIDAVDAMPHRPEWADVSSCMKTQAIKSRLFLKKSLELL